MSFESTTSDFIPAARRKTPAHRPVLVQLHPEPAADERRVFELSPGATKLGRDTRAEIVLHDRASSKRHAEILRSRGSLLLRDEGSRNGTYVDGRRVESATALHDGQLVRVGRALFVVRERWEIDEPIVQPFHGLVGRYALAPVIRELQRAARRQLGLLVLGPTGTGKEVVARAYHRATRPEGPFVAVNVAALPAELFEAEMFGAVAGAFTGARPRRGAFRSAHGGVLFLDEIGSLPPRFFSTLQRALQEGEVRAVGSDRAERVDVLVVAATEKPLREEVRAGRFEASLYNRLRHAEVELPRLSNRAEDLPDLIRVLLSRAHGVEPSSIELDVESLELLARQPWPHNVRQLDHVLRASTSASQPVPRLADLERALEGWHAPEDVSGVHADVEAMQLRALLAQHGGNKAAVARALGIDRTTLYRRLRRSS